MEQLFSRGGRFMTLAQAKEWEKRKKEEAEVIEELENKKPEKFCEFCDAKGPIKHKKDCPTLVKKEPEDKKEE